MYQIKVNDKYSYAIDRSDEELSINSNRVDADIKQLSPSVWHIISQMQSYNVEVVSFDSTLKIAEIKVNNNIYRLTAKDQFDVLLEKLGLSNLNNFKVSELKAPMPGMVLKVFIEEGAEVQKGDNLFILEAMKMENIIKSPTDGIIKAVKIKPGDKIEKGQILLQFS